MRKVELPLALPSIMTGVNQAVMPSLFMVAIAAIIGVGELGFIVAGALVQSDVGRGVFVGLGTASIATMADRLVQKANQANMP